MPLEKQATIVHEMNRRFTKPDVPKGLSLTPSGLAVVGVGLLENLESNRVLLTYLAIASSPRSSRSGCAAWSGRCCRWCRC